MSLFYAILGFAIGLGLGWYLWGRLRGELDDLRRNVDGIRSERDRLKGEKTRLTVDLEACGAARADLERKLGEAKALPSAAALVSAPVAVDPPASPAPRKARKPAAAKPAKVRAAATGSVRAKAANSPAKDNLRRLIGIGPANARKLNEHGVTTFAQIAAWTAAVASAPCTSVVTSAASVRWAARRKHSPYPLRMLHRKIGTGMLGRRFRKIRFTPARCTR